MNMIKKSKQWMLMMSMALVMLVSACSEGEDAKLLVPPTLNNATEITATSFKATWSAVTDAEKYLLDVSSSSAFTTTVTGYSKKEVTSTSQVVSGLNANTKYYFRVFAKKGTNISVASTSKEVTTAQ